MDSLSVGTMGQIRQAQRRLQHLQSHGAGRVELRAVDDKASSLHQPPQDIQRGSEGIGTVYDMMERDDYMRRDLL
jgi:hypothetical protein